MAASSCSTSLVFNVGLHKSATTTIQDLFKAWGFESVKMFFSGRGELNDFTRRDMQRGGGRLLRIFRNYENSSRPSPGLAISDFPIFGYPAELSSAYPNARFVYVRRDFESWFESWRADVLCQWMVTDVLWDPVLLHHWKRGLEFMRFFWGRAFTSFFANDTALCADPCGAGWRSIKADARAVFERHHAAVTTGVDPRRLLAIDLPNLDQSLPALRAFLGCSPFTSPGPASGARLQRSNARRPNKRHAPTDAWSCDGVG